MDKLLCRKECTHVKYKAGTGNSFSDTKEMHFAIGAAVALLQNRGTHLLPTCALLSSAWKMCNLWSVAASILCSWYVMHYGCLFSSTLLLFPGTWSLVAWFCLMAVFQPWDLWMSARAVPYACVTFDHAVIFSRQWCAAFLLVHVWRTLVTVLAVSVYYLLFLFQNCITHTWQMLIRVLDVCLYCSVFMYHVLACTLGRC